LDFQLIKRGCIVDDVAYNLPFVSFPLAISQRPTEWLSGMTFVDRSLLLRYIYD